jgi:hypothetical protein
MKATTARTQIGRALNIGLHMFSARSYWSSVVLRCVLSVTGWAVIHPDEWLQSIEVITGLKQSPTFLYCAIETYISTNLKAFN